MMLWRDKKVIILWASRFPYFILAYYDISSGSAAYTTEQPY
jgi:hypothetical protein